MIYLGVQCMYFRAKPLQNQCILGLVHYTKQTVYLESYFDLNALKMIVKIKFDVIYGIGFDQNIQFKKYITLDYGK